MMVKNSTEQPAGFNPKKRVSFDASSYKSDDCSSPDSEEFESHRITSGFLPSDGLERLLKVAETLHANVTWSSRSNGVVCHRNVPNSSETCLGQSVGLRKSSELALQNHSKCPSEPTSLPESPRQTHSNQSSANASNQQRFQTNDDLISENNISSSSSCSVSSSCASRNASNTRHTTGGEVVCVQSVADTQPGVVDSAGKITTDQANPCRGYSTQKRHGRKASLGTTSDFTRLIPTLVSDNEDFRYKEYVQRLSAPTIRPSTGAF